MIEWILEGKSRSYEEVPEGASLRAINGRDVLGKCEACGRVVLDGSGKAAYTEDGVYLCGRCAVAEK